MEECPIHIKSVALEAQRRGCSASFQKLVSRQLERLAPRPFFAPTRCVLLRLAYALAFVSLFAISASATVSITPSSGGTNISADRAANASSPAWTSLGAIVITEGNKTDFALSNGVTLLLKAPAGFEFNTSAIPNITFTAGRDITNATVAITNPATMTITLKVGGAGSFDQLTIGNTNAIQIRPTAGAPVAAGQIYRPATGGGTAVIAGITTSTNADGSGGSNFGSLSETIGTASKLAFTTQPGSASAGAIFGQQPAVKTQDQFSNNSTSGLPANLIVSVALTAGTGPLLGTTNLDIGVAAGNGTIACTNLEIDAAGTNKQLTASAFGLANALSALFAVNGRPAISSIINQTTLEDMPTSPIPFTIGDAETPANALVLSATSSDSSLVPNTNIVFGGANSNRTVIITPAGNAFGTATITLTVSDGTVSASNSFLLTVSSVNDPPTLNALTNLTILEDAAAQTVNMTGISTGPVNETTQTVTITAFSSNPGLIPNPAVNYTNPAATGLLTFAPLANQFGSATLSVVVKDNGGTASGGIDSLTNSFTVTVTPVNDAPNLDPLTNTIITVNAGPQTVNLTGISPGPTNENGQTVSITAVSSNPGLIPNPTVNYTNPSSAGSLTFAPAANASGNATISLSAKDDGGTANGGQDTLTRQFSVTVNSIADLGLSQVATPNPGYLGGTIAFRLSVTNNGPSTATGIQVTNTLPGGVGSVSVTNSQGSFTNYGGMVVCSLGSLTNGGVATATVVIEPLTLGAYTNSASVWSSLSDPNSANNYSSLIATAIAPNFTISGATLTSESCPDGAIDPAETVTVSFSLQNTNAGSANTTNLVATLRATGGVTAPSSPQTYGVVVAGGAPITKSFTFIPVGSCGGTFTAALQLQDGAVSLGTVTNTFTFGPIVNQATSFANTNFINVPSSGPATPYPSTIAVSGLNTQLLKVTVTLNRVTHSQPDDLDILLVGPGGQQTLLMSDCGGINFINNVTLTFDNDASTYLPDSSQIFAGTYHPTDFQTGDLLDPPAPPGPYVADLSVFNGTNPNGVWQLFVFDDTPSFSGNLAGGWTLNLSTMERVCCVDSGSVDVTLGVSATPDPVVVGRNITFTILATNQGPAAASGVTVTNPIPPNATFISGSTSQGILTNNGSTVVCTLGSLTNNATATMSLTFQPTLPGLITNTAAIFANQPDHALSNNVASRVATVAVPAISIGDALVVEGNAGTTTNAVFNLQLSSPSIQTITVSYATADLTATAGSDYLSTNGSVVFSPGQTNKSVSVTVVGDNLNESSELFQVLLLNPTNVTIARAAGTGTIIDDDPQPFLSINNVTNADGSSGTTNFIFTVTLAPVSGQAVYVDYATADGSAKAGADYYTTNGTLTFNPGETNKQLAVAVIGSTLNRSNQTFFVNLSASVNALVSKSQGVGTILNDDFLPSVGAAGSTLVSETCAPTNGVVDPNETVTMNLSLRNIGTGTASTTNLVATLLQGGGVIGPSAPQNYGALTAGGPAVSRSFTFTANGVCGAVIGAALQLQDGINNLGIVTNAISLGRQGTVTNVFANTSFIAIPDSGTAAPYPSTNYVSGIAYPPTKVLVTLSNLSHTYPGDLGVLLVAPGRQATPLMVDAGNSPITNVTLTFDDAASNSVPTTQITNGTYKPTQYSPGDIFPAPAPAGPYVSALSVFTNSDPNGTWSLYIFDDSPGDSGSLAAGWRLTIISPGNPVCCGVDSLADLSAGMVASSNSVNLGGNLTYTISVTNFGPSPASDVVLTDALPSGLNFVSATSSVGNCTNISGTIICNLGTMTNGARTAVTLVVNTTAPGTITNTAVVSSRAADPQQANNSASNATAVVPPFPIAAFTAAPPSGSRPLAVTFTDNSLGVITNRLWSFGDGSTTNTTATNFFYTYNATGTNTVNLTVSGPGGVDFLTSTNYIIVTNLPPQFSLSPTNLDFGPVLIGQTRTQSFQLVNVGGLTLTGTVAAGTAPFAIQSGTPFSLAPGQTGQVVVTFSPTSLGSFSNVVVFASNGGASTNALTGFGAQVPLASFLGAPTNGAWPLTVSFTDNSTGTITNRFWDFGDGSTTNATGAALNHTYFNAATDSVSLRVSGPVGTNTLLRANYIIVTNPLPLLSLSPTNLDFGAVIIGHTNTLSFQLINIGGPTLTGAVSTATGQTDTVPFTFQSGSPFSLAPGQTGLVMVSFAPTNAASFSNAVIFTSNGGNATNAIIGVGLTPAQLAVSPPSVSYGTVAVGSNVQASFVLTNLGGAPLTNGLATISVGPFSIVSGTPFSLAGFGSTNLVVRFTPASAGSFSNVVVFSSNGGGSTNTVLGTGAIVPAANFTANPTSGVKPLTVSFTDNSAGTITNRFWDFGNGTTTNIAVTNFSYTYAVAQTSTVSLTVSGPVGTNTLSRPNYIVVTNPPPQLSLSPTNLGFGPVVIGQTNTQSFQVVNFGGLTLTGAVQTIRPFAIQSGSPFSLPPGQTGLVMVSFAPTNATSFSNVVVFTSNGGNSTNAVSGSGLTPPQLAISPSSLNFGTLVVGASAQANFAVTNRGGAALTNGVATISGGPFSIVSGGGQTGTVPFSLAGFASTNLVVRFTPTNAASFSNVVVFNGDGGNSTNAILGAGALVPAADFVGAPTIGSWPLTVSFTDNSTGTITNRLWAFGDGTTTNTAATNLSHIYTLAVTSTVTLTVAGPVGSNTLSQANYIVVTNPPPQLQTSPTNLNLGLLVIGQTNTQSFQVVNIGGPTLTGAVNITTGQTPDASGFAIQSGSPFSLATYQTGLVMVSFAPTNAASFSNVVVFISNGGNATNSVTGVGLTPAQLGVSPPSLNFGTVAVGGSAQASFVVTNLGGAALSSGIATISAGPFSIVSGTPFSLAGFGSTNVVVRFAPVSAASFSNTVVFSSSGGGSTNAVLGTGAPAPTANFSGSPRSGVKPLTVSFTDTSTGTITNRFWDFGDGTTTNTAVTNFSYTYTLALTSTVTLTVSGSVGTNTLSRANYITVTNPPPLLSLSPTNLNYGGVMIGRTNVLSFQVVNGGGQTLTGAVTTTRPFAIQSGSPFSVAPGQTGLVMVSFAPTNVASFSNVVVFTSNGGKSTNTVSGTGVPLSGLAVSPTSLNFGNVAVGSTAQAGFLVTNLGGTIVSNGIATISGGPFSILSGSPFSLAGFASTNLVVRFGPTNAASFSNVVVFTSSDGNSTNAVLGAGALVPTANYSGNPTSGVKPLTVSFTDNSTGTITNRFWNFGDGTTTNAVATTFSHTYALAATNTVSLTVSGPVGTNTLSQANYIIVTNPPPQLSLSPANLNFGSVVIGQTNSQSFQVVNTGGLTLTGAVSTTLPFTIRSGSPFSLAAGQTGLVMVSFAPTNATSFSNVVVFTSNGGNATNSVTGTGLTPAQLAVSPPNLSFGTVAVGTNAQASFVVTNLGGAALTNGVATISAGPFSLVSGTPFSLAGFGSTNLPVRFAPATAGSFSNVVVFTSNGGNSTNAVLGSGALVPTANFSGLPTSGVRPLTVSFTDNSSGTITNRFWDFGDGTSTNTAATNFSHAYPLASTNTVSLTVSGPVGTNTLQRTSYIVVTNPPPLLTLSPANLSFGAVVIGRTNVLSFQVVNSGGLTLTGAVSATLPFAIASGSPFNLPPGQAGQVQVAFGPASAGSFSNLAIFTSNGGNSTNSVTGSGLTPARLAVTPGSLNFGTVAVGSSAQASFVITNQGGAALSNGLATISPDGSGFTVVSGTPFSLSGFGSTNLVVSFAPDSPASFSNVVVVSSSNGGSGTNALTGTGAVVPVASFSGSPTSGLKPLTVSFTDNSTGTITNRFWDFGDSSTINTSATIISHTYATAGTSTVSLTVSGPVGADTLSQPNYIIVTNPPPQLSLSPSNLDFGPVVIGQTSTQSFEVVNSGGLTLTGAVSTATGQTGTARFVVESGSPFSLAAGQTGLVMVSFAPTNAASFSNVVVFTSNGGNSTNGLSGTGLTPAQLAISPSSLDFGTLVVGSSALGSFIVTNLGGAPLTDGLATIGAGPFSIVSGTPFSLAGFGSTNIVVRFAPDIAGSFSNAVVLTSNGGNSTNVVLGSGAVVPSANFSGTPTRGVKPLTVSFTDNSTGTITDRYWDFGDGTTTNTVATTFSHAYGFAATNTVSLTVSGPVGSNTLTMADYIVVTNPPPRLQTSPTNLDFGSLVIGQTSAQSFQVVNTGGLTLTGAVSIMIGQTPDGSGFAIESGSPFSLAAGQTGLVMISFAPTNAASFSDVVVFASNGGNASNTVTGVGLTPGEPAVLPPSLTFGTVAVGSSATASFVITNLGGAVASGVATIGQGPFSIVSGTPFTLAGFGSSNLVVSFAPDDAVGFSNVVIFSMDNGEPEPGLPFSTNTVVGSGALAPTANFSADPTSGLVPLTVVFSDSSAGTITNRFWDFGDGATTNTDAASFSHTYATASTKTVSLTVSGPVGVSALSKSDYITVTNLPPQLQTNPTNLDFGKVIIGQISRQSFQVINLGGPTLTGAVSTTLPFAIESGSPFSLAAGQTGSVMVSFAPASAGSFSNVVVFSSNGGNFTNLVTGFGLAPAQLVVSPLVLDFGIVAVGASTQASFVLSNLGDVPITNGLVSVGSPDTSGFNILSETSFNLDASRSTNVFLRFSPTGAGSFSDVVVFTTVNGGNSTNGVVGVGALAPTASFSGDPTSGQEPLAVLFTDTSIGTITNRFWDFGDGTTTNTAATNVSHTYRLAATNTVSLTVSGPVGADILSQADYIVVTNPPPQLSLSPTNLDFSVVAVGQTATQTFQVVNIGGLDLTGSITTSPPFNISDNGFVVAPGQIGQVQVTFSPTNAESFSNVVVFSSNGGNSTNILTGSGALVPVADFIGNPIKGAWPLIVSFTDDSTGTITNRSWDFGDGTTTNTSATDLSHTYTSAATSTVSLTVSGPVGSDTLSKADYIVVTDPPPQLSLSPTNLDFGPIFVGQTNIGSFQVVNTGGLTLTGAVFVVTRQSDTVPFVIQDGSPFSLVAGQTGVVTVAFTPTNATSFSNEIVFASNGGNITNAISGIGLALPQFAVSPAGLAFGAVALGTTAEAAFVVSNLDTTPITNGSAVVSDGPFSIVSGIPFNLPGFGSANIVVHFTPISEDSFSNVVVFTADNAASATNALTGTGAQVPVAGFIASPTSGLARLIVSFTDSSTGTITNRFWDFGDGTTTNTAATNFSYTYTVAATNTVSLTVSGPLGANTLSEPSYIVVTNGFSGPVRITSLQLAGANVIIRFETAVGLMYRLEYIETLNNGDWSVSGTNVTGTGGIVEVTDPGISATSRFYRVRQLP